MQPQGTANVANREAVCNCGRHASASNWALLIGFFIACCPPCSHKKKRMQQIKKLMQRGLLDPEQEDPFSLFVASTNIRYCYYSETHKILGNTFGMCVLQVRRPMA